ncbi:hypothetical protein TRVL_02352 [Trypanosoma vivax]|nr:hypothetical protein TRVL_02352 [Trypanosoma vivax]
MQKVSENVSGMCGPDVDFESRRKGEGEVRELEDRICTGWLMKEHSIIRRNLQPRAAYFVRGTAGACGKAQKGQSVHTRADRSTEVHHNHKNGATSNFDTFMGV